MKNYAILAAAMGLVLVPAKAQQINGAGLEVLGARAPDGDVQEGRPLPTNDPIAPGQAASFEGQTRAPAVRTVTPILTEVRTENLNHPWGMAFIENGRILVTEKPGNMRIVDAASGRIVGDVENVPTVVYGGDAGLLDVVTDPSFAENRTIYFTYVEPAGDDRSALVVARARLVPGAVNADQQPYELEDVTTILSIEPAVEETAHYGSRLLFDREGNLLVSTAERFFSPFRDQAQSLYSHLGKILRIDTDGNPAPGNPFDRDQEAENHPRAEIWSLGHRNPQGLAIEPSTGDLWSAEHGPQGGDEVNRILAGANYGWPLVAYGTDYDFSPINGGRTQSEGTQQPRYYWDPAIAPGSIAFYSGDLLPEWSGNLFVAALAGQHLARLVIEDGVVVGEERLLQEQNQRVRDVEDGPDGALWVLTDSAAGRLIRLSGE